MHTGSRLGLLAVALSVALIALPAHATRKPPHKAVHRPKPLPAAATQVPAPNLNAAPSLQDISNFASAGAPNLALQFIDRDQPDFEMDPEGWMAWERERIYLYRFTRDWQAVIARTAKLPVNLGADFRSWEQARAADAWLQLGKGREARAILRRLIWNPRTPLDDTTLSQLRQLVVRSYLVDQDLADAQTAVIRYRQDYPKDAGDWPLLEARLFLRTGQPQAALDTLRDSHGTEARMLTLLAALRAGTEPAAKVIQHAEKLANNTKLPVAQRVHAWYVIAQAALAANDPVAHIQALQAGLGLQPGLLDQDPVFGITPGMLWDAYLN
ncbi:MAG: hypothetical protein KGJ17_07615, partial [Gammaproteobacteria bacterium]|nr:hypothetical protein [Gammaproteobacteria bacterium]